MRKQRLILWLLAGCGGGDKSPPDSPSDTTVDSADTSADTGDSDSSDSGRDTTGETAETGETGDTGAAPPCTTVSGMGYGVPTYVTSDLAGWDDADCTDPTPGRTMSITMPTPFLMEARFLAGQASPGPHQLTIQLHDCVLLPCTDGYLDPGQPYTSATLDASGGKSDVPRGLGGWGPDTEDPRRVAAEGLSFGGAWADDGTRMCAAVTVCLERVRPDVIRGVVRAESSQDEWKGGRMYYYYYPSVVYRFPFEIHLDEHAGFDTTQPEAGSAPAGFATARYLYDIPYEEAWPWEEIEDASVAQDLHDRYTPYNAP